MERHMNTLSFNRISSILAQVKRIYLQNFCSMLSLDLFKFFFSALMLFLSFMVNVNLNFAVLALEKAIL